MYVRLSINFKAGRSVPRWARDLCPKFRKDWNGASQALVDGGQNV